MRVLLIDGFNLIRRLYEARPHDNRTLDDEVLTSSVQSLRRALSTHTPSHVCCIFDSHTPTWRHELYTDYKANRKPTPTPLLEGLPRFKQAFESEGVKSLEVPGFEADDVIATMARRISETGGNVIILSTDKSFLQLIDAHLLVFDHFEGETRDSAWVRNKFGVSHTQLVDYWCLTGDSSINVKGVPGIGPKTAGKLIQEFSDLESLLDADTADKNASRVKNHESEAVLSRTLVELKDDIELGINLKQFRYQRQTTD